MGRNRNIGAPLEAEVFQASFQAVFTIDVALCDSLSAALTVTLDPDAVEGDQLLVTDVGGNAATNAITIQVKGGTTQTIVGFGSSMHVTSDYGSVQLTFSGSLGAWVIVSDSTPTGPPSMPLAGPISLTQGVLPDSIAAGGFEAAFLYAAF